MKAIRVHEYGGPANMRLEEVADPTPGPRQLVITVKAAGINPIDTYIRSGTYAKKKPPLPYTPGFDAAGVVEAAGSETRRFKPGDRVFINGNISGAYAEKTLCDDESVFHLPEHLSFAQGSGVWVPYATAHQALHSVAHARAGETLLVHVSNAEIVEMDCVPRPGQSRLLRCRRSDCDQDGEQQHSRAGFHRVLLPDVRYGVSPK